MLFKVAGSPGYSGAAASRAGGLSARRPPAGRCVVASVASGLAIFRMAVSEVI